MPTHLHGQPDLGLWLYGGSQGVSHWAHHDLIIAPTRVPEDAGGQAGQGRGQGRAGQRTGQGSEGQGGAEGGVGQDRAGRGRARQGRAKGRAVRT